jgi:TrmH family RNA methyltransferase
MASDDGVLLTSVRNPRIVAARKLKQRKHRERQDRFLVEDLPLLHMALDAGAQPLEVFYCESQPGGPEAARLLDRLRETGAETAAVSAPVMQALAERETPQGILATFALFETDLEALKPGDQALVVVVDRLQDPGNLGTLIRTADAVGAAGVILIEPCVDPFDPKTVRGSMGSLFNMPLVRTPDVRRVFEWARAQGLRVLGTDAQQGIPWGEGLWTGGVALALGNEARGLSDDVRAYVEAWARLPIAGRAESLNVAVAGGVLMYTWLRTKLGHQGGGQ